MATAEARAPRTTRPRHRIALLPLDRALALGEPAWEALRRFMPAASPFSSWAWHDAWHQSAPDDERRQAFALTSFGADGEPTAVLPLAARPITFRRTNAAALTWAIGDVGCPDHLDVLAAPGAPMAELAAALEALEWDMLQLDGVAEHAPGVSALRDALEARGTTALLRPRWSCPYVTLPGAWSEYLAARSPARAAVITRRERVLARRGTMAVSFHTEESLDEAWRHLRRLHDARWEGSGAFDARLDALHRRFAAANAAHGRLWLSTIDMDGQPISAWYGFADRRTVHFYQAGRAPEWNKFSVGAVHVGLMIQRAIALGFEQFDFLRGEEPYKTEWTDTKRSTYELVAFRRNARGRMLRLADQAGAIRERLAPRRTA